MPNSVIVRFFRHSLGWTPLRFIAIALMLAGMAALFCSPSTILARVPAQPGWVLIWSDEFSGKAGTPPDPRKWTFDLGATGWGNHELEEYTANSGNASLDGAGHLAIRALKINSGHYTSGRLKTAGLFEVNEGRIEARIRIPHGQGLWPAFWMLGASIDHGTSWPANGEIDIMENIGKEPGIVHGTVHGPGYAGAKGISSRFALGGDKRLADGFHVYRVEWSRGAITFDLDGHPYGRVTPASLPVGSEWVFDHPFFLLLNVAVGGDWPGTPDTATRFPQTMLVDWVRVWQKPAVKSQ